MLTKLRSAGCHHRERRWRAAWPRTWRRKFAEELTERVIKDIVSEPSAIVSGIGRESL
jgi:hypothetical protein